MKLFPCLKLQICICLKGKETEIEISKLLHSSNTHSTWGWMCPVEARSPNLNPGVPCGRQALKCPSHQLLPPRAPITRKLVQKQRCSWTQAFRYEMQGASGLCEMPPPHDLFLNSTCHELFEVAIYFGKEKVHVVNDMHKRAAFWGTQETLKKKIWFLFFGCSTWGICTYVCTEFLIWTNEKVLVILGHLCITLEVFENKTFLSTTSLFLAKGFTKYFPIHFHVLFKVTFQ